jgi:ribose transport system permease protein
MRQGLFASALSAWVATLALFCVSWFAAPGSVSSASLHSMLPFASILAIAAVGQTLVVQQRGIDLSVPGSMTLAAVVVSQYSWTHGGNAVAGIAVAGVVAVLVGLMNGVVVAYLKVTPLVVTLAMNAVLVGVVLQYSGGTPPNAPNGLTTLALKNTWIVPNTVIAALVFVGSVAFAVNRTIWGRRFVAVGANGRSARAVGISVDRYRLTAYVLAAICYWVAGTILAGYVSTPSLTSGDSYLLPSVAAVVVGGTALTGGRGRIVGSAVGAVFLSQLTQLVLSLGMPTSSQLLLQSLVIMIAAGLQTGGRDAFVRLRERIFSRRHTSAAAAATSQ